MIIETRKIKANKPAQSLAQAVISHLKEKMQKIVCYLGILGISIMLCCSPKATTSKGKRVGETVELKDSNVDWEAYDNASEISKSEIDYEDLQGNWKAYRGIYRFGEFVNGMELTEPMIIEIEGDKYRRNTKAEFESFQIQGNLLLKITALRLIRGL